MAATTSRKGGEMKRFGHLFERIVTFENLRKATLKAARGKRSKPTVARFLIDYEREIIDLQERLVAGTYRPKPYFKFTIFEPKERSICSSEFEDRVLHHAVCNIIEPLFERRLISDTYACRVGKGAHLALARCQQFARLYPFFLKLDIAKYFDSVDHTVLKQLLAEIFKDEKLLSLLGQIIDHSVPGASPGKGLPIGNLTSQHFANLYLGELDHFVKDELGIPGYARYMDDFVLFHHSKAVLKVAHHRIVAFLDSRLRLKLKARVTTLAPVTQGVPYLGFRVFPQLIRIQRKNLVRMRRRIAQREGQQARGKISDQTLAFSVGSVLAYVAQANTRALLRKEVRKSIKMA